MLAQRGSPSRPSAPKTRWPAHEHGHTARARSCPFRCAQFESHQIKARRSGMWLSFRREQPLCFVCGSICRSRMSQNTLCNLSSYSWLDASLYHLRTCTNDSLRECVLLALAASTLAAKRLCGLLFLQSDALAKWEKIFLLHMWSTRSIEDVHMMPFFELRKWHVINWQ